MPAAAFVSAGGYHHHLGLNSWQSAGGSAPPEGSPGLRLLAFELSGEPAVAALAQEAAALDGARRHDGGLLLHDPDGHALSFAAPRG